MTNDLLMIRAARLRREAADDSPLIRALGRWLDWLDFFIWNGDWQRADEACDYVRAVYLELTVDEVV